MQPVLSPCPPFASASVPKSQCSLLAVRREAPRRNWGRQALVIAHAHPHGSGHPSTASSAGVKTGFIDEMREVAMRLHTPRQAPGQGKKAEKAPEEKPVAAWKPTREGYLRFLVQSKAVYDTLEGIMASGVRPEYGVFTKTGLERGPALAEDVQWMAEAYGMAVPAVEEGSSGDTYSKYLQDISKSNPQAFICHWYNQYFAHTAGGIMIGKRMSAELLDGKTLKFYEWEGDVKEHLARVRERINEGAEGWTREEKDKCLEETELSFKYSGALLREIAGGGGH